MQLGGSSPRRRPTDNLFFVGHRWLLDDPQKWVVAGWPPPPCSIENQSFSARMSPVGSHRADDPLGPCLVHSNAASGFFVGTDDDPPLFGCSGFPQRPPTVVLTADNKKWVESPLFGMRRLHPPAGSHSCKGQVTRMLSLLSSAPLNAFHSIHPQSLRGMCLPTASSSSSSRTLVEPILHADLRLNVSPHFRAHCTLFSFILPPFPCKMRNKSGLTGWVRRPLNSTR